MLWLGQKLETAKPTEIIDRIISRRRKQNGETKVAHKNTVSVGQGRWGAGGGRRVVRTGWNHRVSTHQIKEK